MKRITNFIIDKRYFILILFLCLTGLSCLLSFKVKINYDISKYLPDTSQTRKGLDLMEDEFIGQEESTLNVMFRNLKSKEKGSIKKELESFSHVKKVDYDETSSYNKGKSTLYVLTIDGKSDSKTAKEVYQKVLSTYQDKTLYTSGDVSESNKTILPFGIIALAVFCALLILLVMCESYIEPFLFLATILMAVVLNKGTNIFFPSVSHITNSIAAILQMALSMDYSIMLMNRYDQEKRVEKDKVKAMKNALHKAFQSISSSSLTTIVGLLALVFMSFKIGKDLGFILAKGVLFSLLCIFFVLPALILMFDKWIQKTKKKSPSIHLKRLGKVSYHCRYLSIPVFLFVFLGSFFLKGNLNIAYTDHQADEISKVFKEKNQMAIIYPNQEEKNIQKYLEELENVKKIDSVLGYSNTINEKLTYQALKKQLEDLGSTVSVEDYLLKIIYYDFFHQNQQNKMTLPEFVTFIENEAYQNPKTNEQITPAMKKEITRFKKLVLKDEIQRERTPSEIGDLFEIDPQQMDDLMVYYLSLHETPSLSLNEFVTFMEKDVLPNEKYASQISQESKNQLSLIRRYLDLEQIKTPMNEQEIASFFQLPTSLVHSFYQYVSLYQEVQIKLSLADFSSFVAQQIQENPTWADPTTLQQIQMLSTFSQPEIITQEMSLENLSTLFGIEEEQIKNLLLAQVMQKENTNQYTLREFVEGIKKIQSTTSYLEGFDESVFNSLEENSYLLESKNPYTVEEMAQLLQLDKSQVNKIYHLISFVDGKLVLSSTPYEFVSFILQNQDLLQGQVEGSDTLIQQLQQVLLIMESTLSHQSYTYQELSSIVPMDEDSLKKIYQLYFSSKNQMTMTPYEFVDSLLLHQDDSLLKGALSQEALQNLTFVKTLMESAQTNKQYSSVQLSSFLGLDEESTSLLYGLYQSLYAPSSMISNQEFVSFLLHDVLTNKEYQSRLTEEKIKKLKIVDTLFKKSQENISFTADEVFALVTPLSNEVQKNLIEALYTYYGSCRQYDESWTMTVEEFVNDLNERILKDERFEDFIDNQLQKNIVDSKKTIQDAKKLLVGKKYSRVVLNTKFDLENKETFEWISSLEKKLQKNVSTFYLIGDSPMAYEMSQTFDNELNLITVLTMIAIFVVVALTFKSLLIPLVLVLIIQCAVYLTMGLLTITGDTVYFIAILIVQSILMGATIDYAILYTSYYLEHRKTLGIKDAILASYQQSLHTILTSSLILMIVTLVIASFTSAIASKICKTISQGTLCSTLLILILLPAILACLDKIVVKKKRG